MRPPDEGLYCRCRSMRKWIMLPAVMLCGVTVWAQTATEETVVALRARLHQQNERIQELKKQPASAGKESAAGAGVRPPPWSKPDQRKCSKPALSSRLGWLKN